MIEVYCILLCWFNDRCNFGSDYIRILNVEFDTYGTSFSGRVKEQWPCL
jgi:hypothetical protein